MTHPWEKRGLAADLLSGFRAPESPNHAKSGSRKRPFDSASQQSSITAAIERCLAANPILEWIEARLGGTKLKRVATTDGGEWCGPCVVCGGADRMRVWPAPREGNPRAWCRQCGVSGDILHLSAILAGHHPDARGSMAKTLIEQGLLSAERQPLPRPVDVKVAATRGVVPTVVAPRAPVVVDQPAPVAPASVAAPVQPAPKIEPTRPDHSATGAPDADEDGRPLYGCFACGGREYCRDLVDRAWVCATCHPVEEYRAHLPCCTSRYPRRRGGCTSVPSSDQTEDARGAEAAVIPVKPATMPVRDMGEGGPLYGCARCGLHEYARTPDSPEWKCASCVRPDPARTDVERWTAPRPARRERRVPFMHPREEGHKAHGPVTAEQLAHDCGKSPHSCLACGCLACMDCGRIIYIEVLDDDELPNSTGGRS